ncbi:uncharacterized protein METZ01_LOCUS399556, partial [marine metagenome]
MEYKTNRNLKIRVADPIGYALMIAGIPFIAVKEAPPFDFVPNLMVSYAIGLGLVMLGAYRASLVTTDLSCNTCTGVILESKSIDQKLKGDFLGLSENKAEYIRTALSSSTEDSEHDCPDCGEKMSSVEIPIEVDVPVSDSVVTVAIAQKAGLEMRQGSILVPDAIEELSTVSKIVELDGCKECDLLWFENAKTE